MTTTVQLDKTSPQNLAAPQNDLPLDASQDNLALTGPDDLALDVSQEGLALVGLVEAVIAELVSPTYQTMTSLVYHALVHPRELAGLHRHQLHLPRNRTGRLVVCGQPDPTANRIITFNPALTRRLAAWITRLDPDPTLPLFPHRWHPGWRTALARTAAQHGHRSLTPEQCRRAGLTRRWATNPDTPTYMAALVGLHPTNHTDSEREVA